VFQKPFLLLKNYKNMSRLCVFALKNKKGATVANHRTFFNSLIETNLRYFRLCPMRRLGLAARATRPNRIFLRAHRQTSIHPNQ